MEMKGKGKKVNDLSDKGGKKAIIDTIRITMQPIILIVNDYYNLIKGSGESLKNLCKLIKFYDPYPNSIVNLLKRICILEKINTDSEILKTLADRSKGDIRSAVNDLQSLSLDKKQIDIQSLNILGIRDRKEIIFNTLRDIFRHSADCRRSYDLPVKFMVRLDKTYTFCKPCHWIRLEPYDCLAVHTCWRQKLASQ